MRMLSGLVPVLLIWLASSLLLAVLLADQLPLALTVLGLQGLSMIGLCWWWGLRHVRRPMRQLAERAEAAVRQGGSFGGVEDGPREIRRLSRSLRRLLGALEKQISSRDRRLARTEARLQQVDSRLQRVMRAHRAERHRFARAFDHAPVGMALLDLEGRLVRLNRSFLKAIGDPAGELAGRPFSGLLHEDEVATFERELARLVGGETTQVQLQQRHENAQGDTLWGLLSASLAPARDESAAFVIVQLQDITEACEFSEQLRYQAQHDALTGLFNRHEFEQKLREAIDEAESDPESTHLLCYVDLDQFKVINDTCGHLSGDELLKRVADCLTATLRTRDVVGRLGGDEFGLILRDCPREEGLDLATRLKDELHEIRYQHEDKIFRIGASMGIAVIQGGGLSLTEVMKGADTACYMAKEAGRNRIRVYDGDDDTVAVRTREMLAIGNINQALDNDRFVLVRQPIVALDPDVREATGRHYEVLLRMLDWEGRMTSPEFFLGAAERYHLASKIDRWVVETVLGQLCGHISRRGQREKYAINLSGHTLTNREWLEEIARLVEQTSLDDVELCFEITETAAVGNLKHAQGFIERLRSLGCTFALDDFGRGLSSFGYLKHLSVDYLKIDGEFVRHLLADPIDLAMVRSINEVAHAAGKLTVAEYVEDAETARVLAEMGVDFAQGFHFGRPEVWISPDELAAALKFAG